MHKSKHLVRTLNIIENVEVSLFEFGPDKFIKGEYAVICDVTT